MRIALLLTGFTRSHQNNFNSIRKFILDRYDTDVYFATWDKTQGNLNSSLFDSNNSAIIDLYSNKLKNYSIINFEEYLGNKKIINFIDRENDVFKVDQRAIQHGSFWVERLRDQWYLVNIANNLISENYDKVIRLRFDINLLNFDILEKEYVIPSPHPVNPYTDHMAYGNQEIMNKYCSLYSSIETLYQKYNVDVSFAEFMLKYYMENTEPPAQAFIDTNIKYEIIK